MKLTESPVVRPSGSSENGLVSMSGGGEGAYVLLSTGEVLAWGNNGHGQLGNGTTNATSVPTAVDLPKLEEELKAKPEVASLSGGNLFALALRPEELCGIRWPDLDLTNKSAAVGKHVLYAEATQGFDTGSTSSQAFTVTK